MVDEIKDSYSEIAKQHWFWILISVVVLVAAAILGILVGPRLPSGLIQRLLSVLITAVASVLAIVFSVLFISTQIASERYSPKFTASIVNDPLVQLSFLLGISSIIINIFLLVTSSFFFRLIGGSSQSVTSAAFWALGGLLSGVSIVFFLLLYPIIRIILIQTSPDNLLSQFRRRYGAFRFRKEAENAESVSSHPMQPVYDFARNSMRSGNYTAAVSAIETLYEIPTNSISKIDEMEDEEAKSIFEPIIVDYGRALIIQADKSDFPDVVSTASEGMVGLGREAINTNNKWTFDELFSTSKSIFNEKSRFKDSTREQMVKCCRRLFSEASSMADVLDECIPRMVKLAANAETTSELKECLHGAKDAHRSYINAVSSMAEFRREESLIGCKKRRPTWKTSDSDDSNTLLNCTYLIMDITSVLLAYSGSEIPGFVYGLWECAIADAKSMNSDIHLKHLLRRYVELLIYIELNYPTGIPNTAHILQMIDDESLHDSAISVCDDILNEDRSRSEMCEYQFLERDLPEIWSPIPMTDYSDEFREEIKKVRQKANS